MYDFTIDRKNNVIEFKSGYWFPIEHFSALKPNYDNKFVSEGLFHLSKKNWVSESLFDLLVVFCKKEFPELDFDFTIEYIKERRLDLEKMFRKNG